MTASSPTPVPQAWQVAHHPAEGSLPGYAMYQRGSHAEGTFIRVYVPELARSARAEPLRTVTYLHGFALCMPRFYEAHLIDLVRRGHLVFFPDFQRSLYPDTPPGAPPAVRQERRDRSLWRGLLRETRGLGDEEEVFSATLRHAVGGEASDPGSAGIPAGALRRTLWPLSLPSAYCHRRDQRFAPTQVLVADPAASTEMGIPAFAIWLLKLFGAPFTADPIRITATGGDLSVPVAILHGAADALVPPAQWATAAAGPGPNFTAIVSSSKALLFSWSNAAASPPLVAFHNQAVTSTAYYDDALFRSFGGVKHGANAYNTEYIWPALHLLLSGEASPPDLLERLCPCDFQVQPLPPAAGVSPPPRRGCCSSASSPRPGESC